MLPGLDAALAPDRAGELGGRTAFRCVTSDRLPMIGQLGDEAEARHSAARLAGAWPLDLPRMPGLYGAFAYGSRGLVWSALGAELIASQLEGEPWPLERELAEQLDPARFLQRALRQRNL
jgi:tRNA 5-methylaminomethyl-2-thiouridine biosynthesis bifunctional protein